MWGSPWADDIWKYFKQFFVTPAFKRALPNTLAISVGTLIISFPVPIILALLLNQLTSKRYKKIVQTTLYAPHFISTVVMVGMIMQVFHNTVGLYGTLGRLLTGSKPPDLFASPTAFVNMYVWSGVWKTFGWSSILYIACLGNVSVELMEAAEIDGANRLQRVWHIEVPALLPTIIIQLILRMGSIMSVGFEKAFLMQNDLNLRVSEVISTYVYKMSLGATTKADYSFSTAIGLFNSVINLFFVVTVNQISRKVSDTSLW
jgi:putative aldouronate transport system permease protein